MARTGEERGAYRVLMGKPEGKRPLGRPRRRWVDNIRMDLQEAGCGHVDWIGLAQDRDGWRKLVSAVMSLNRSSDSSTTADDTKYGSTNVRRCNYSLRVLLMMGGGITQNM